MQQNLLLKILASKNVALIKTIFNLIHSIKLTLLFHYVYIVAEFKVAVFFSALHSLILDLNINKIGQLLANMAYFCNQRRFSIANHLQQSE